MSRVMVTMPNFGMLGRYWNVMLWNAVRADAVKGGVFKGRVWYHATLSPRPVFARCTVRPRTIRVHVWNRADADDFTADIGHLDRFIIR